MSTFIVGAYASAPADDAQAYTRTVAKLPGVRGLEIQFADSQTDIAARSSLDPSWDVVLTTVLATVLRNNAEPDFGLASPVLAGRATAVGMVKRLNDQVHAINDRAQRAAVIGVELHSAPRGLGTASALAASLRDIAKLDWDGALLTVEHCDSARSGLPVQKGYLSLEDEVEVIAQLDNRFAVTVNWGRSAIDGRSPDAASKQIRYAADADVLGGLMFSGVADVATAYGPAWADAHLPPSAADDPRFQRLHAEPTSLLTPLTMSHALRAAHDKQRFTGLKIGLQPAALSAPARTDYVRDALYMLGAVSTDALR